MTRTEILQTAKPILFNTEMVQAILGGRKTVTRRVLKNQDKHTYAFSWEINEHGKPFVDLFCNDNGDKYLLGNEAPYQPGDILYVREAFAPITDYIDGEPATVYAYKASTLDNRYVGNLISIPITAWHPSIHMPKEAARIFLRVTDVRVERLQDMTMKDILSEGVVPTNVSGGQWQQWQQDYMRPVWDTTIKKSELDLYGWEANPWVWVIEFEKMEVQ